MIVLNETFINASVICFDISDSYLLVGDFKEFIRVMHTDLLIR